MLGCTDPGLGLDWVGDGYCDDVTNIIECNYDGGDCCLDPVNTQYCSECQCIDGGSTADPGSTDSPTSETVTPSGIIKKT